MSAPTDPVGRRACAGLRMISGYEILDEWSRTASQAQINAVHRLLLSVTDRSVFTEYCVVDDALRTMEFFVFAKCDITVKVRVHSLDAFGVTYIGPTLSAPGLDQAGPESAELGPEAAEPRRPQAHPRPA